MRLTRREFLKISLAALGGLVIAQARSGGSALAAPNPTVFSRGRPDQAYIALTYDDGYDDEALLDLEALLDRYPEVKVTFFMVGVALEQTASHHPDIWKRLIDKGHELGYHSHRHIQPSTMTAEEFEADYSLWLETMARVTGRPTTVRFARPPYGEMSYSFLELCENHGLVVAMWSTNWGTLPAEALKRAEKVANGDVALLHVRYPDVLSTHSLLPLLAKKSISAVTLTTLYAISRGSDATLECFPPAGNSPVQICPT